MEELVSVVFSNASYQQQKLMLDVTQAENMRSYMQSGLRITTEELRTLFGEHRHQSHRNRFAMARQDRRNCSDRGGVRVEQVCTTRTTQATYPLA